MCFFSTLQTVHFYFSLFSCLFINSSFLLVQYCLITEFYLLFHILFFLIPPSLPTNTLWRILEEDNILSCVVCLSHCHAHARSLSPVSLCISLSIFLCVISYSFQPINYSSFIPASRRPFKNSRISEAVWTLINHFTIFKVLFFLS